MSFNGLDNSSHAAAKNMKKRRWKRVDRSHSMASVASQDTGQQGHTSVASQDTGQQGHTSVASQDTGQQAHKESMVAVASQESSGEQAKQSSKRKASIQELRQKRTSHYVHFKYPMHLHPTNAMKHVRVENVPSSYRTTTARYNQPYRLRCQYLPGCTGSSQVVNHKVCSPGLPVSKAARRRVSQAGTESEACEASPRHSETEEEQPSEGQSHDSEEEEDRERNAQYQFVYNDSAKKDKSPGGQGSELQSPRQGVTGQSPRGEQDSGKPWDSGQGRGVQFVRQGDLSSEESEGFEEEEVYSDDFDEVNDEFEAAAMTAIKTHNEQFPRPQSGRPESRKSGAGRPRSALKGGGMVKVTTNESDDELEKRLDELLAN